MPRALLSYAWPVALLATSSCGASAAPSPCTNPDASADVCCTALLDASADAPSSGCFSNADCPSGSHCTVPPGANGNMVISCCAPGPPGAGTVGGSCTTLDDCASAVCVYTPAGPVCSQDCSTVACPSVLPTCVTLNTRDAGVTDGGLAKFCGP